MRSILTTVFLICLSSSAATAAPTVPGPAERDPFMDIYTRNVSRMHLPDATFEGVPLRAMEQSATPTPARTSATCSQRCSTTCSKSCTTTRGCSSNCKVQTDGCGGTAPQQPTQKSPYTSPTKDQTTLNVQRALVIFGYRLCADGVMGDPTRGALQDFQQRKGLSTTGAVDPPTWNALMPILERASP